MTTDLNIKRQYVGYLIVIGFTLCAAFADTLVLGLARELPWAQVHVFSHFVLLFICLMPVFLGKDFSVFRTNFPWLMTLRALASMLMLWAYFTAFKSVTLFEFFTIISLLPLMSSLLSFIFLRERLSKWGVFSVFLGSGAMVWGFLIAGQEFSSGTVFCLLGVFFSSVALMVSRYIQRREDATYALVFYPTLGIVILPYAISNEPLAVLSNVQWIELVGYSVLLVITRLLMPLASKFLEVSKMTVVMNVQLVWVFALEIVYFGAVPTGTQVAVAGTITLSAIVMVLMGSAASGESEVLLESGGPTST